MIGWLRRLFALDNEEDEVSKKEVSESLNKAQEAAAEAESAIHEAKGAVKDYWAAADKQTADRYRAANGVRRDKK